MQECLVLNLLNQDAERTSAMINERLNEGWQLFTVLLLSEEVKREGLYQKSQGNAVMVVLVRDAK